MKIVRISSISKIIFLFLSYFTVSVTWGMCDPGKQTCPPTIDKAGNPVALNYMHQQAGLIGNVIPVEANPQVGGSATCPPNTVLVAVTHAALTSDNQATTLTSLPGYGDLDCQVIPVIGGVTCKRITSIISLPKITYTCQAVGLRQGDWTHD